MVIVAMKTIQYTHKKREDRGTSNMQIQRVRGSEPASLRRLAKQLGIDHPSGVIPIPCQSLTSQEDWQGS